MSTYKRDSTTGNLIPIANKSVIMTGATSSANGTAGNVPAPTAGQQNDFLTGGGVWTPDTANLTTTFTSSDDATETGIIVASGETSMTALTSGDTHGGLFGLISKSVLNTRKLINTVKRVWNTVANSWAEGEVYAAGDVRLWTNGHTYVCKLAHTSSASITPADTTYWDDQTLGDMISSLNSNLANKMYNPNYGGFKLYFPQGWTSCKLYFFHKSVNVPANGDKSVKFEYPNIGGIPYVFVTPYVENVVWCYCTYMISSLTATGGNVSIHNLEGTAHDINLSIVVAY